MSSWVRTSPARLLASLVLVAVVGAAGGLLTLPPAAPASAATTCYSPWISTTAYTKDMTASISGHNFRAKWWTKNESPMVNPTGVWSYLGECGESTPAPVDSGSVCPVVNPWVKSTPYDVGDVVSYTDGNNYIAVHANPGYNPTVSTWYWDPYTCPSGLPFTEEQFRLMFPLRNPLYTYQDLSDVLLSYPAFGGTGSDTVRRQEVAAFLANANHETGGLRAVVESNTANYANYCATWVSYGCPAGQSAYYGRGPMQLSWNFNYKAAGDALGVDLLNNPWLLEQDGKLAWKTTLWYWMTKRGIAPATPHDSMVTGAGFGQTIRAINGSIECDGGKPSAVQSRVNSYLQFTTILGVPPGNNLTC